MMSEPSDSHPAEKPAKSPTSHECDADVGLGHIQLVRLEHQTARRDIGLLRIIAIGFNIPNSWVAIAASFSIAIAAGGPVSLIYGSFISCTLYACAAVTLAELASVYPTAGGQYHFTSILAPKKLNRFLAYTCGILSSLSWTVNAAGCTLICSQLITAFPQFYGGYTPTQWQLFLLCQAFNIFALFYNLFLLKRTNWIHDAAFVLTLATFAISCITCLARGDKAPSKWVWTSFEANTGWAPGVSFLTGLTTPCYMYGGLDAALHLAEETLNASHAVPKALMAAIGIGFLTGFVFSVVMAYCITDLEGLLTETVPIYKLWRVATESDAAATVFLVAMAVIVTFILIAIQHTSSRLVWALACDRGLFLSSRLSFLSPSLGDIPANAPLLNAVLIFLCGCLYLGSTAAFNALVNTFLLLQILSFALPAALLIYQKRDPRLLPRDRAFRVPEVVGWICNIGTVVAAIIETVFFTFPTTMPVTAGTMNYAAAVLGGIAILAAINWFVHARKYYQGPRVEIY
ncbi:hypothetical protein ACJZ2D_002893 [Fusarium nematophilum]